jgi:hypothetical protein
MEMDMDLEGMGEEEEDEGVVEEEGLSGRLQLPELGSGDRSLTSVIHLF